MTTTQLDRAAIREALGGNATAFRVITLLLRDDTIVSMADIACLSHVTHARVTQIMDRLLAPDIQEKLLHLAPAARRHDPITAAQATIRIASASPGRAASAMGGASSDVPTRSRLGGV